MKSEERRVKNSIALLIQNINIKDLKLWQSINILSRVSITKSKSKTSKRNIANVTVNGIPFEVEMKQPVKASKQKVKLSEERRAEGSEERRVKSEESNSSSVSAASTSSAPTAAAGKPVVAPLPYGTINEIKVKVGDKVNAGDTVVILEAMKMQNHIEAETSGTITSINVNKGDAVMEARYVSNH